MSEATPAPTESKDSLLKRFARAFRAKVSKAARAVKAGFIRATGDNETPIREDEGVARKFARRLLSIPKWAGNSILAVARVAAWVTIGVIGGITLVVFAAIGILSGSAFAAVMVAYKLVHLLALVLRTPYLAVRSVEALRTDWSGYIQMWRPKYFAFTHISQVFSAQAAEAALKAEEAAQEQMDTEAAFQAAEAVSEAPAAENEPSEAASEVSEPPAPTLTVVDGKGKSTPRQHKRRPRRIPRALAEPGV